MPRWLWFGPLVVLTVAFGMFGFRLGWISATISETDVIEIYAARYVGHLGAEARLTDCTARPGQADGVWIVVTCVSPAGARFEYPADRLGRLLRVSPESDAVAAPET